MIDLNKKRLLGDTVAEYLVTSPFAIDNDGEGLWQIVPAGRSFGFEGADLAAFVRLSALSMLEAGGVPVRFSDAGPMRWLEQKQFGTGKNEIADAVVAEWQAAGAGDPPWEWLWFVTRRVLETEHFRRYEK